jgi:pimeloyl-ACP methyl ester carboxylesterase
MWRGRIEAFKDHYRPIPWDMRGHGATQYPDELNRYRQAHTEEDMKVLLDHLEAETAVITGHSLCGFMSLAFNVRYPERVKALVLQGCGPGYRKDAARETWNEQAESRAKSLDEGSLDALSGNSEVTVSLQNTAAGLALAARGILSQVYARVIDSLPGIAVPTLIIICDGDSHYLVGSDYIASRITGAVSIVVADAGHGTNVDQLKAVNLALGNFLDAL